MSSNQTAFILQLEQIIAQRLADNPDNSYTASLVNSGNKRVAQKVAEEALELALAAAAGDRAEQLDEAADLVYHLLILLQSKGIKLADVANKLQERHQRD